MHCFGQFIRITQPNGLVLDFQINKNGTITLANGSIGVSNFAGQEPSGKCDLRNIRLTMNGRYLTVRDTDGSCRHYQSPGNSAIYSLQREVLPNGKVLRFSYNSQSELTRVESLEPVQYL